MRFANVASIISCKNLNSKTLLTKHLTTMKRNKIRRCMVKGELALAIFCVIIFITLLILDSKYDEIQVHGLVVHINDMLIDTMFASAIMCIFLVIVEHIYGRFSH